MITYDKIWKYNIIAFVVALILAIGFGVAMSQSGVQDNEKIFNQYPSDGTPYNEIRRYYGSCEAFGDIAAACYDAGYSMKTKSQISESLAKKYWIMSQGQLDVCNMMFNKATYDQFMGEERKNTLKLYSDVKYACSYAIDNIDKKSFNKEYHSK